jgi:outer membrane protein OmpA-like peptidoglycan-associated protein
VKTKPVLKITKPAKPKQLALRPSRDTKPVRVAKRPVRRRAPNARAIKREPVEVARLGSNSKPITTASVPLRKTLTRSVANTNATLPTKSRPIRVYFSKDSAQISPRDVTRLRQLASLQKSSGKRVHVRAIAAAGPNGEAEADANALNKLAVARAKAVATKLWGYGVKSSQMVLQASQEQAVGQGRSTLQAARIRRAEIYIE